MHQQHAKLKRKQVTVFNATSYHCFTSSNVRESNTINIRLVARFGVEMDISETLFHVSSNPKKTHRKNYTKIIKLPTS